ncbi:unnamed protein product [Rhizophagus irregularis]|nr:unnamed protein product [Rhizophagus irregularis]CAB5164750.1 unnamed protein product [Rhizophagus irregularis]
MNINNTYTLDKFMIAINSSKCLHFQKHSFASFSDYSDNSWETFGYFVGQNEKSGDDQAKVISARGSGTGFETMSTHGGSLGPGSFLLLCGIVNDVIRCEMN